MPLEEYIFIYYKMNVLPILPRGDFGQPTTKIYHFLYKKGIRLEELRKRGRHHLNAQTFEEVSASGTGRVHSGIQPARQALPQC